MQTYCKVELTVTIGRLLVPQYSKWEMQHVYLKLHTLLQVSTEHN